MLKISLEQTTARPPTGVYDLYLPPQVFGVLQQVRMRMTRESLDDLAASIKAIGQQAAGIAIGLNAEEAEKYLGEVNDLWGTEYRLEEYEPVYITELAESFYVFLVAGYRRLVTIKGLNIGSYLCRLHLHVRFVDAFSLQFHENVHKEVPLDDEARFLTIMWRKQKSMDEGLSLAEFARRHGKKPDAIRRSIRFTSLPISVQKLMLPSEEFKKGIAFGILCELARLQEARQAKEKPYEEQELIHLSYVLVVQQKTAKAAAVWVSEQIKQLEGQGDMFGLSIEDAVNGARKSVGTGLEYAVRTGSEHLRIVARLHGQGGIEKVASGSAVNAVTQTLNLTTDLAPAILEGIKGGRHAPEARKAIKKAGT